MKIGIIKEGKVPPDYRVPLTPQQCKEINEDGQFKLVVQSCSDRCFTDDAYRTVGVPIVDDISDCNILMGVKEVPIDQLIPGKTYFFFSHTIKEQAYNRDLLRAVLDKNITLIDYEMLTDHRGHRVIAFGEFAGMVGAHNAVMTYGSRTGLFSLKRMKDCFDYKEATERYAELSLPNMRIVLTGTGRVGQGAAKVLQDMGITKLTPEEFLARDYDVPVFTQLDSPHYVARKDGRAYQRRSFHDSPQFYKSTFLPFTWRSDILIHGIYWNPEAPAFFTAEEMRRDDFNLKVIADVTCDIAPDTSIPSTLRATTIEEPVFGYDPITGQEVDPFQPGAIDMMTIDNLPNELPRDASRAFGKQFIQFVLPELHEKNSEMLHRATIAENGRLGDYYLYLADYAGVELESK